MTIKIIIKQFAVALVYFLIAVIALEFAVVEGNSALIWPSSGLALAILIYFGRMWAAGVFLGAFIAAVYAGNEPVIWILTAMGNTLEPLIAIYLLRFLPFSRNIYHIHDYFSLIIAGSVGAVVSALLGGLSLYLTDFISLAQIPEVILHWWMADALGILIIAPFLLLFNYSRIRDLLTGKLFELLMLLSAALLIALMFYAGWGNTAFSQESSIYLLIIPITWAILRFGYVISALVIAEYFVVALYGLLVQKGVFWTGDLQSDFYFFAGHFSVISISAMLMAYVSKEKHTLQQVTSNSYTETYIFCEDDISFEFVNQRALDNHRLSLFKALKLSPLDLKFFTSEKALHEAIKSLRTNELSVVNFATRVQRLDNTSYPAEITMQLLDASNRHSYLLSVSDISEKINKEKYLKLGNFVCDLSPQSIMVTNNEGHIIRVNTAFTEITGYSAEFVIGKNPNFLKSGRHDDAFYKQLWLSLIDTKEWVGEVYNRRKNGELYLQSMTIKAIHNSQGELENYIAMGSDITQLREDELQLKHQSEHDVLTSLPNKKLLRQEFAYALATAKRHKTELALLFIDINDFKPVNDNYGHIYGDYLLQTLATRMKSCIRETDMVSRIGGDEFVVLVSNTENDKDCAILIDKLKKIIAQALIIDELTLQVSASIGVASYPEQGDTLEGLLHIADEAMYADKKQMKADKGSRYANGE